MAQTQNQKYANSSSFSSTSFYGNKHLWEVTPDYWKPSWGAKPRLGFVKADNEFYARYAAYDKGLLPINSTFGPEVSLVK